MSRVSTWSRSPRRLAVPVGAVAIVLSAASIAFACTFSGGSQTYVGPTTGPVGTTITASGAGAAAGIKHTLRFADATVLANTSNLCRVNGKALVNKLATSAGYIPNTAAVIPAQMPVPDAPAVQTSNRATAQGNGQVCWVQKANSAIGLTPALWTVT